MSGTSEIESELMHLTQETPSVSRVSDKKPRHKIRLTVIVTSFVVFLLGALLIGVLAWQSKILIAENQDVRSDAAASGRTFYLSPNGNDNNPGTSASPWKTLKKADSVAASEDTIVLKDGVYSGYVLLTKSGVTWLAENKHKAIIDGGFAPGMLNNNWENIVKQWDTRCLDKGNGKFAALLGIKDANNVTIDGIFLRNSCGRGFAVTTSDAQKTANNIVIKNSMIDWTISAGVFVEPFFDKKDTFQTRMNNFQFIDNVVTRTSVGDEYNARVLGACQPKTTPPDKLVKTYCVNISLSFGGINTVVRGNVFAWGEGELAPQPGSKGLLFENNLVVGNKNSFYAGMVQDAIVRNNLFYAPEYKKPKAGGDEDSEATGSWRFGLRNEAGHTSSATVMNTNIAIYNNLIVNMGFFISGANNAHIGENNQIYFGNNTLIAGKGLDTLLNIKHGASDDKDPKLTGIMENNIFDRRKNPLAVIAVKLSGNDNFVRRNNLWPTNVDSSARGQGDVYSNDPGLVNALAELNLTYPNIGPDTLDITALRQAVDINNYRLKNNSVALDKGTTQGGVAGTSIPSLVRSQDFSRMARVDSPDLGALELHGVSPSPSPSPSPTASPSPSPTASPTPSPTFGVTSSVNLIKNGSFVRKLESWNCRGCTATVTDAGVAKIDISKISKNMQFYQSGIRIIKGKTYLVSFRARSSNGSSINKVQVQDNQTGGVIFNSGNIPLTTKLKAFSFEFTPKGSGTLTNNRLRFWFVGNGIPVGTTYWIDDVKLIEK